MENTILLYQDENNLTKISVHFSDEGVWMTQNQIAEVYDITKQNIRQHIKKIFADGELDEHSPVKEIFTTAAGGKNYNTKHFSCIRRKNT